MNTISLPDVQPAALSSVGGSDPATAVRIMEIDVHRDARYERFVRSQATACVYHDPGWLDALEAEYGRTCVVLACENENGDLEAVLPLAHTLGLPFRIGRQEVGRRLSSLPRTPIAGPVFARLDSGVALLQAALARARESRMQLQIKSQEKFPTDLIDGLTCTPWRPTYVLEIPSKKQELRFGDARNRHNIKWAVNKAANQGLRVRFADTEADLRAWYPLYLQVMRRNVVPARSLRLFVALWKNFMSQGIMQLRLAEQWQGERRRLVAGSIFLTFGDTVWYAFTGIGDMDLGLHANDLILWHAINDACGTGVRWFDFGEVAEDHPELVRFKTKWGAQPREQYRYYSGGLAAHANDRSKPRPGLLRTASKLWQRLPLRVTERLGTWAYSRL